jgi:hypothetical protein
VLPNADRAEIDRGKLQDYLLSPTHPVGRFKARFFAALGYSSEGWRELAADLRGQHLAASTEPPESGPHGQTFTIRAILKGPNGQSAVVRSVWFIATGTDVPRFVTAYPGDDK